jgi:hypothetical protein
VHFTSQDKLEHQLSANRHQVLHQKQVTVTVIGSAKLSKPQGSLGEKPQNHPLPNWNQDK